MATRRTKKAAKSRKPKTRKTDSAKQQAAPPVEPIESRGPGRPSPYLDEYATQARKLAKLGATDIELADFFGVDVRTIYRWKLTQPEFCQALKAGKETADERVEQSLYRRATGYSFDSQKIMQYEGSPVIVPYTEHVVPDTTACIFWLKNRKPDDWRDKQEHEHGGKGGGPIPHKIELGDLFGIGSGDPGKPTS